ncbi:hypothetical protein SO694_000930109 [Aureococcus anophagefferens]|uniref:UDP-N-acetylglucosamine--peptide N-acetylglucosaminyltransferase SPINDLY n=1 Tax=Aureococcus anophagefferens TaxID=44056 RepID=A0ABR1FRY7_AURAN
MMLSGRATRRALSASVVDDVLAWSALQGHILSGGGRAETFYSASRGFPFDEADLPHHHLRRGTTRDAFDARRRGRGPPAWVVGAWERPAFVGGGAAATPIASYYSELWRNVGTSGAGAVALRSAGPRDAVLVVAGAASPYASRCPPSAGRPRAKTHRTSPRPSTPPSPRATSRAPAASCPRGRRGRRRDVDRDAGDLDDAASCYRRVLALDADNHGALYNLGYIYEEQRRFADAINDARRSTGNCYMQMDDVGKAIATYEQVVRDDDDCAIGHYNLGSALHAGGPCVEFNHWFGRS